MLATGQLHLDRSRAVSVTTQSLAPHVAYRIARSRKGESVPVLSHAQLQGETNLVETDTREVAIDAQQVHAQGYTSAWEGHGASQVAVYMNGLEHFYWQLKMQIGEANSEEAIANKDWKGFKGVPWSSNDYLGLFRRFMKSSLNKFALAVRSAAIQPAEISWGAYVHPSVATALASMGFPEPSPNQANMMKRFVEQVAVGQSKEGLIVRGAATSDKTVALLAIAVSTAIETSEGIAQAQKQMGISKNNPKIGPGDWSIRADEESVSPLVIVLTSTTALADQVHCTIKRIATHGDIHVNAQVYHEGRDNAKKWDYVSHLEGRTSYLFRQVDIAVCTPGALSELIWDHTISTRNIRLVMLQNGDYLFERERWGGKRGETKQAMKQLAPKNYQTVVSRLWPWMEQFIPMAFMSYSNAVRVVVSASDLMSDDDTDQMIEALNPFHGGFVKEIKLSNTNGTKPSSGKHEDTKDTAYGDGCNKDEKSSGDEEHGAGEREDETNSQFSEDTDDEGGVDIRAWL
ncbi:hypothetical protein PRZ48_006236 [Zasmidium cellare]|uniref:RNA helicase n=1 Tax=Zasmidium cellare TaxID=395010 RepID=A0ABR0ENJ5_ZASCE|nr:hypothetical protein PRZ48_006236 [Zasmidium cellare]